MSRLLTGRLLTAGELAELLSVPESWVEHHTRQGNIPHLTLGRYKRYELEAVEEWLDSLRAGGRLPRLRRYAPSVVERRPEE